MPLTPGTRLGAFTLIQEIGRGGMGEVYRARDTKLDRDVAIKVLPEAFAHDADRLARFLREAKTLASLNHPNPAGAMMAAPIRVTGARFEPGAPVVLFPTRIVGGGVDSQQGRQYDVAPDGRFLINTELDSDAAPITLIQNWNPEVKK